MFQCKTTIFICCTSFCSWLTIFDNNIWLLYIFAFVNIHFELEVDVFGVINFFPLLILYDFCYIHCMVWNYRKIEFYM